MLPAIPYLSTAITIHELSLHSPLVGPMVQSQQSLDFVVTGVLTDITLATGLDVMLFINRRSISEQVAEILTNGLELASIH